VGVVEAVGRRTLKVSVLFGDKKKTLQTKLNHIKPLKQEEAKEVRAES
jgi:ribosomal protein L21E